MFTGASPSTIPPFPRDLVNLGVNPASILRVALSALPQRTKVIRQHATHLFRDSRAETENLNSTMGKKAQTKTFLGWAGQHELSLVSGYSVGVDKMN